MKRKKRILVAPLDWGLGHAARCVPVINEITSQGHEAILASDGRAYDFLKAEFPDNELVRLKGYVPRYPVNGNMVSAMALQLPKFLAAIANEHSHLEEIIGNYSLDAVISDNRYGLYSNNIRCVLMTHQLFIRMPKGASWMGPVVNRLNHYFIRKFDCCWIPDQAGTTNLSGALSHGDVPSNTTYIGLLSRCGPHPSVPNSPSYTLLALLSGPEPQRSILEREIIHQATRYKIKTMVVAGITERKEQTRINEYVDFISYLTSNELSELVSSSETIICRSGYSTLMDLIALRKNALLVPTPGQTEQEYLAERCCELGYFRYQRQAELSIDKAMLNKEQTSLPEIPHNEGLTGAIAQLLQSI